jgi:predicted nucleic acid-binding protein
VSLEILDASVAIKWFVAEEPGRAEALRILDRVRDAPQGFAVPELFFDEMLAVLVRLAGDDATAVRGYIDALQDLGLERIGNGREMLARAAEIACTYGLTGYDAILRCERRAGERALAHRGPPRSPSDRTAPHLPRRVSGLKDCVVLPGTHR